MPDPAFSIASSPPSAPPDSRYVLVAPCRDEARYCRRTLDSVIAQTLRPTLLLVIDDGSTDETPHILADYARQHDFIRIITRPDRGKRKLGGGVIDAFYEGYHRLPDLLPAPLPPFFCKLDLDLDLPPTYFQTLVSLMHADPRLGTVSGKPYFVSPLTGQLIPEVCGPENSVGMTKFYRTECFRQIGGFVRELMWDGIDCHRCRMLGWKAAALDLHELRFTHLRPMGTSDRSWWRGRVRHGFGQYFMGTSPAYMLASAAYRTTHPPYLLGSLAMLRGYFGALLSGAPRYDDPDFRRFLRSYQWTALIHGKREAARRHLRTAPANTPATVPSATTAA